MFNAQLFVPFYVLLLAVSTIQRISSQAVSIDQEFLNAGGLNALDVFHVERDGTIMVRQELDIMTPLVEFKSKRAKRASSNSSREERNIISLLQHRWPDGFVPYEITDTIEDFSHGIREALNGIMELTCIQFEENDTYTERIQFFGDRPGCYASVGHFLGHQIKINLHDKCHNLHSAQHEILHTLGVFHEHTRPDRDKYIKIVEDASTNTINFERVEEELVDDYGIEYDYRSIMHYQLRTGLIPKDLDYLYKIGLYTFLSIRDIKLLNIAYGCTEKLCCNKKKTCPFGGVVIPNDYNGEAKCQCWCSSGQPRNEDQLVLCSSLTKSMEPVYQLSVASSLLEAEHEECSDLLDNCNSYKEKGLCFAELIKMKKLCTKTCNFCGKGKDICMDHDESCSVMAESGVCQDKGIEKLMSELCPKSCGQCTGYYSACDLQKAMEEPELTMNSSAINSHWLTIFIVLYIIF